MILKNTDQDDEDDPTKIGNIDPAFFGFAPKPKKRH
jgi:hypothetical protein